MILVDSSVWIAHLRGRKTDQTVKLAEAAAREPLLVGDLIMLEILQGARDDFQAARIERDLRRYHVVPLLDDVLASRRELSQTAYARHYGPQDGRYHYRYVLH